MLLSKGFEVELFTGTPAGEIVGLSDRITAELEGFVREPDSRNVEYTTAPRNSYEQLLCDLVIPRQRLRHFLLKQGNYTLIPGSTLSLSGSDRFHRSDPGNPYHAYIEKIYGTKVVTASIHINIGINDPELLMKACRLIRVEAPLYLALSASSPILDGNPTGYHSTRWHTFPQTPARVPIFESHGHFIQWTEAQHAAKTMQNGRHLWSSVRPNGDCRPYKLNRLELRICDMVSDPISLLSITALLEARLWQLFDQPELDPLVGSRLPEGSRNDDLVALTAANEIAAARYSLGATLRHWQDGRAIAAKDWLQKLYAEVYPYAKERGFSCFLSPVLRLAKKGNEAQRWLTQLDAGHSCKEVVVGYTRRMAERERKLAGQICQNSVA